MVIIPAVDILGLPDLIISLSFHITSQFLFVDDPAVVLAIVAVVVFLFRVFCGRQSAIKWSLDALYFVLLQLVPDYMN